MRDGDTITKIDTEFNISSATGRRWRAEQTEYGTPIAQRRTRRFKAEQKGHKLRPAFRVDESILHETMNPIQNDHCHNSLSQQAEAYSLPLAGRSLQYNLKTRVNAQMYAAPYTYEISKNNKTQRQKYSREHELEPLHGF